MSSSSLRGAVLRILAGQGLRSKLLRGGAGSVLIKGLHSIHEVAIAVVLARVLGPTGFGVYALATATIRLLAIPAQAGLPILVVREVAALQATENWPSLRGILIRANQGTFIFSSTMGLLAVATVWTLSRRLDPEFVNTFWWALLLLPLIALGNIRGAALRGLHRIVAGQLPESVIRPVLFLALIIAYTAFFTHGRMTSASSMRIQVISAGAAFLVGARLLLKHLPAQVLKANPHFETRKWLGSAIPLSLVAGMYMLYSQIDLVLLGLFRSTTEVGIYRVASQTASLVAFFLTAANTAIAPFISQLYAVQDTQKLQRLITASARVVLACSLPIAIVLFIFGETILIMVFGQDFRSGYLPLVILVIGQIVNSFMGPVGNLQNMTGRERDSAMGISITAVLNLILNLALIPMLGILGSAIASAAGMIVWNFVLWHAARKHLGIECMAVPLVPLKKIP